MYTIIVTVIVFAIISGIYEYRNGYFRSVSSVFGNSILGGMFGVPIGMIIALIVPQEISEKTETYLLENLNDLTSIQGSFFLGTGSVDGSMRFVYYYKDGGSYKLNQVDYKDSEVIYKEDLPKVEIVEQYLDYQKGYNKWTLALGLKTRYVFQVPKGSITRNYKLDAQ